MISRGAQEYPHIENWQRILLVDRDRLLKMGAGGVHFAQCDFGRSQIIECEGLWISGVGARAEPDQLFKPWLSPNSLEKNFRVPLRLLILPGSEKSEPAKQVSPEEAQDATGNQQANHQKRDLNGREVEVEDDTNA